MLTEIGKLDAARAVGLPDGLFSDVAPKVVAAWRARAAVEAPSHLRDHPRPLMLTLLAALVHERQREITDTLADLLISTVHRIGARAERKVTQELVSEFRKVAGKETLLFRLAEAAIARPDDTVRAVVYPVAGEKTLRDLVAEYKSSGPAYRRTVQTTLRASYTGHYRRGLIQLLEVLEFRTGSSACQPVIEALALIRRYAAAGSLTYYPAGEHVPAHAGITEDWKPLVYRTDQHGRQRVVRMVYEVVTFQALREHLRCKEIWITGADRWRNPDEDLPADFETRRAEHYASLRKPLDPSAFITELREEMRAELDALHDALPRLDWLQIAERREGNIKLTPLDAAPEPRNLRQLKKEIAARWGTVPLIDMLKEAVLRTGCLTAATSAAARGDLDPGVLAQRLLLAVYAYGTNTGIRAVAAGEHGHSEDDIRYVRRRYLSPESARAMAVEIANATFAARHQAIWGDGLHRGGVGLHPFRRVRPEHLHRMARPLRRPRRADLLARRAQEHGHPLPADRLLGLRGRRDDRGRHAARHHDGGGSQLHRLPRPVRDRVRRHPAARLRPAAPDQADQQDPAVPPGRRRPRRLAAAGTGADPADPLGPDRFPVRPDDQVRHRDPHRDRLHRGHLAAVHQGQRRPPRLPGHGRGRPRAAHHFHSPLPA